MCEMYRQKYRKMLRKCYRFAVLFNVPDLTQYFVITLESFKYPYSYAYYYKSPYIYYYNFLLNPFK